MTARDYAEAPRPLVTAPCPHAPVQWHDGRYGTGRSLVRTVPAPEAEGDRDLRVSSGTPPGPQRPRPPTSAPTPLPHGEGTHRDPLWTKPLPKPILPLRNAQPVEQTARRRGSLHDPLIPTGAQWGRPGRCMYGKPDPPSQRVSQRYFPDRGRGRWELGLSMIHGPLRSV